MGNFLNTGPIRIVDKDTEKMRARPKAQGALDSLCGLNRVEQASKLGGRIEVVHRAALAQGKQASKHYHTLL